MLTGKNDRSRVYRGRRRFHLPRRNDTIGQRTDGTGWPSSNETDGRMTVSGIGNGNETSTFAAVRGKKTIDNDEERRPHHR
jgi:hypothetical protein